MEGEKLELGLQCLVKYLTVLLQHSTKYATYTNDTQHIDIVNSNNSSDNNSSSNNEEVDEENEGVDDNVEIGRLPPDIPFLSVEERQLQLKKKILKLRQLNQQVNFMFHTLYTKLYIILATKFLNEMYTEKN